MRRLAHSLVAAFCAVLVALGVAAAPAGAARTGGKLPPGAPHLTVTAASLIDAASGQQLYGVNPTAELPIASTTKLMTALVTLQHVHKLGTLYRQTNYVAASGDSQIALAPGERMSVHDLLIALMLPSADDAAIDLAYNVGGGSIARFVAEMNAGATALHLTRTHYANPVGFDQPGNYSSAYDLNRLAAYDLATSPFFARVVEEPRAVLRTGNRVRHLINRNDLVGRIPWVTGVKTGHTSGAHYVMVVSGTFHGLSLIGSVLGTSSESARDANALALLEYGFKNFREATPVTAGTVVVRPTINGESTRTAVIAGGSWGRAVLKSDKITVTVTAPRDLTGPLPRHAVVGTETALINGRRAARIPLILARAVPAVPPLTQAARFVGRPITLVVLALALCVAAVTVTRRRRLRAVA
jgi:D-alanyl-D-alanine carboxypeptidase (penicillin-binding protein 5/6)